MSGVITLITLNLSRHKLHVKLIVIYKQGIEHELDEVL
jgi:hypothetical protein